MTNETTEKLKEASIEYRKQYAIAAEATQKRDEIKDLIKELAKDENFVDDNIKLSHVIKNVIDYKGMVMDSGVEIPELYKSTRTETRITLKKQLQNRF
jgi:hypothetical protein